MSSKELETKVERIEVDKVFSLDTIQGGDWTHFYVVIPYMDSDSLIEANGIICSYTDMSELRRLTMFDDINTLLILKEDRLKKIEALSRSIIDFSGIVRVDSVKFSRYQPFIMNKGRSVSIFEAH
ncbi:hypothetical protein QYZ87_09560 [Porphyromonadaceae bacterium W3.11]|nr:hypothetical protein [Porphyromonadaceae bacterium W3.11]